MQFTARDYSPTLVREMKERGNKAMSDIGYKVCAEMNYPSGLKLYEWNYYIVSDEALLPSAWIGMSDDDKATYLNEDANCHWVQGWLDGDGDEVSDDEAGLQDYIIVELGEW